MSQKQRYIFAWLAILIVLLLAIFYFDVFDFASRKRYNREVSRAFYYWQTSLNNEYRGDIMDSAKAETLYMRIFDVDHSDVFGAYPRQAIQGLSKYSSPRNKKVIPTVFITQRSILNLPEGKEKDLAEKIVERLKAQFGGAWHLQQEAAAMFQPINFEENGKEELPTFFEFQFDCDWTAGTQQRYFNLLKELKLLLAPAQVSVTIRLYQYANHLKEGVGVPPVDRGMLMLYNIEPPDKEGVENSIFDLDAAKPYLRNSVVYPLPLDIALPIFKWGLLFRDGKLKAILNKPSLDNALERGFFTSANGGSKKLKCEVDTALGNVFLRVGDELRVEDLTNDELLQAARIIAPLAASEKATVALFDLQGDFWQRYDYETVDKVYNTFR